MVHFADKLNRRTFLATGAAAGAASAAGILPMAHAASSASDRFQVAESRIRHAKAGRFRRLYAPHFGMFRHHAGDDLLDQIRFMADEGFRVLEDNGLMRRPVRMQERIGLELDRLGMQMGLFIGSVDFGNPTFASGREELRVAVLRDVRDAIATARRVNAKCCTIVPGRSDPRTPAAAQEARVIETLKLCAEMCDAAGVTILLEPLNHWGRHPQMFLHSVSQAARICRSVGDETCRILFDVYYQQSTQRDAFGAIERHWSQIGYFQLGDSPGRKEPGTGGFDYRRFFQITDGRGYAGVFGMEHGNAHPGRAGERSVIDAYVALDSSGPE